MRSTKQRQAVRDAVHRLGCHPSADAVYEEVRKDMPGISLGTVYRNLRLLSEAGEISAMDGAGSATRYDGCMDEHYHFRCDRCGVVPFAVTIEHHSGSKAGDFKGVIRGECAECATQKTLLSFTGQHRRRLREEKPVCRCGNGTFVAAECERIEGDGGLLGFFDEGVVVGQCPRCGRNRALVHTD